MGNALSSDWNTFGGEGEGDQAYSKKKILGSFVQFQERFLNRLDRVLEFTHQSIQAGSVSQDLGQAQSDRIVLLFEEVLKNIYNLGFIQQQPDGNIQFVIAQLGPILQRISDQLAPFHKFFEARISRFRSSRTQSHLRSRSQDTEELPSIFDSNFKSQPAPKEVSYPKFCLGLIQLLKEYYERLAQQPMENVKCDGSTIKNISSAYQVQELGAQVCFLQDSLQLTEQMLRLKSYEAEDCSKIITSELERHLKDLKGDYLKNVVDKIKKWGQPLKVCL